MKGDEMVEVSGNSGELPTTATSVLNDRLGASEAYLAALLGRMRTLEVDHMPDDWPAVKMEDVSALCDAVVTLNTKLKDLGRHAEALAGALDGYQDCCGEEHPRPNYECETCGKEERVLSDYRAWTSAQRPKLTGPWAEKEET
jgi:hypothetical protein